MSVIPVTWEVKVEGSLSEAIWKSIRPYLKNKLKQKGLGCGSSGKVLA
jgi:hypothetical protein